MTKMESFLTSNRLQIDELVSLIEEATRSTEEGVKRFIEPAPGTLRRAISKRHHIVFGRRGSGKSSLLRKAAADLTIDRRPIAYVDLETFKGHSYPDVLLSVLIKTFEEFEKWLRTAAINPSNKKSFWQKLFGSSPSRKAFNKKEAQELADKLNSQINELKKLLYSSDDTEINKKTTYSEDASNRGDIQFQVKSDNFEILGKAEDSKSFASSSEFQEAFKKSKVQFLHQHILEYQKIFKDMSSLSDGDSFLFLDDLYHIRKSDQANVIDYFHRIAKGNNLWLKIGTIRYRTRWYINGDPPIGLKIGDDADDIDLDLTLEKYSLAKDFLIKILKDFLQEFNLRLDDILTPYAVDRLVLASGGVVRDFLGIFRRSINCALERLAINPDHARGENIGAEDVNNASGEYDSSKREELVRDTIDEKSKIEDEFGRLIEFCRTRKFNVFLVEKDSESSHRVQELVDLRLIHKIASRVTVRERPGKVFEAYMLDLSQYSASRKMRNLKIVEFWKPDSKEELRKAFLIYDSNVSLSLEPNNTKKPQDKSSNPEDGIASLDSIENNDQLELF